MSRWRMQIDAGGGGITPSGRFVSDGYSVEVDEQADSRWRITYTVDGKQVVATVDLGKRWEKKYGPNPHREMDPTPLNIQSTEGESNA